MGIHTKQSLIENSAEDDCTAASPTYPPISRIIPRSAEPMPFPILRFYNLDKEFDGIIRDLHERAAGR